MSGGVHLVGLGDLSGAQLEQLAAVAHASRRRHAHDQARPDPLGQVDAGPAAAISIASIAANGSA